MGSVPMKRKIVKAEGEVKDEECTSKSKGSAKKTKKPSGTKAPAKKKRASTGNKPRQRKKKNPVQNTGHTEAAEVSGEAAGAAEEALEASQETVVPDTQQTQPILGAPETLPVPRLLEDAGIAALRHLFTVMTPEN